jgi:hypothetical protein
MRCLRIGRHRDGLGADVVADARFDRMRRVHLEHRLHLVRRASKGPSIPGGQLDNRLDIGFARDTLIDCAGAQAQMVGQAHKDFGRCGRPASASRLNVAQRFPHAARLGIGQKLSNLAPAPRDAPMRCAAWRGAACG